MLCMKNHNLLLLVGFVFVACLFVCGGRWGWGGVCLKGHGLPLLVGLF
jgi:hypothetical protein